jgi:hypothetical protein
LEIRVKETIMKPTIRILVWVSVLLITCSVHAQSESGNDDPSVTTNLGIPLTVALNPTGRFLSGGWGVDSGVGYNFDRRNALIGEFMWNTLNPTNAALQPIRVALQSPNISGHTNLFALTGNYRYELRGKTLGAYFIGGGGWYRRSSGLTKPIPTGTSSSCDPAWLWWGYNCTTGIVITNVTIASSSSTAFGANGGVGFTIRVGEAPYRVYVESRYHYAPTGKINTQLVTITAGIRY